MHLVPFLVTHTYSEDMISSMMGVLFCTGSNIGGKPEGIVVYVPEADHYQKVTFEFSKGKWCKEEG